MSDRYCTVTLTVREALQLAVAADSMGLNLHASGNPELGESLQEAARKIRAVARRPHVESSARPSGVGAPALDAPIPYLPIALDARP